jgi:hypothetical protein
MIGDPPTDGTNWLMIAHKSFMKALPRKFVGELIFFLNLALINHFIVYIMQ